MLRNVAATLLSALLAIPLSAQNVSFSSHSFSGPFAIVAHGDFNNDGREDFLHVVQTSTGFPAVDGMISTGDGTYKTGSITALPANGNIAGVALADFNRDGRLDFAVALGSKIYIYLGNGDGTFKLGSTISVGSPIFRVGPGFGIAAADFNHDSKTDLVALTTNSSQTTFYLHVYFSNGFGGFTAGPVTTTTLPADSVHTGDFDGDGKADVVTTFCSFGCSETAYYGDGTGHFVSPFNLGPTDGSSVNGTDFVVADVNRDGRSDLIRPYTTGANGLLQIIYGQANRTLTSQDVPFPSSQCTFEEGQVVVADFNGNGIPDVVVPEMPCNGTGTFTIDFLPGLGSGNFGAQQQIFSNSSLGGEDTFAILGDRDTEPDLAFTSGPGTNSGSPHYVLLNTTLGHFNSCSPPSGIRGIRVCSPLAGSTVSSPVRFAVSASGSVPMRKVEVWADGKKLGQVFTAFSSYAFMDASLPLSSGTHVVTIFAAGWDNSLQRKSFTLNVH